MSSMVTTLLNSLPMYRLPGYRGALADLLCAFVHTTTSTMEQFGQAKINFAYNAFCGHYRIILFNIN